MAGSGYKLFATGDVLTAAQVNNYLQEQTVMVFADAAARTTALASVLAEGMISYLKDTDVTQYYSGSAWVTIGGSSSPLTTKGDLWGYSTTNARVPVGTNGQILTADSTNANGVAWAAPAGFTYATYTPTYTNFTLGNGTVNAARWAQSGKMVHVYGQVTLGSTSSVSGNIILSLPATAASTNSGLWTGWAAFGDDGVGSYTGFARINSTTTLRLDVNKSDGTYNFVTGTSSTIPMTWTNLDDFRFSLVYEAA